MHTCAWLSPFCQHKDICIHAYVHTYVYNCVHIFYTSRMDMHAFMYIYIVCLYVCTHAYACNVCLQGEQTRESESESQPLPVYVSVFVFE